MNVGSVVINCCRMVIFSISVGFVKPDNQFQSICITFCHSSITLLSCSPTETAGHLYHLPSITLFASRCTQEGNLSAPAGKPPTGGHATMLPPSTCFYGCTRIGTVAPRFVMLQLSVTQIPKYGEKSYTEDDPQQPTAIS